MSLYGQLEQLWLALRPNTTPNGGTPVKTIEFQVDSLKYRLSKFDPPVVVDLPKFNAYRKAWLDKHGFQQEAGSNALMRLRIKNAWKRHLARQLIGAGIFADMPPEVPPETDEPRYRDLVYE